MLYNIYETVMHVLPGCGELLIAGYTVLLYVNMAEV